MVVTCSWPSLPAGARRSFFACGFESHLQICFGLLAAYGRKTVEEIIERMSCLEVVYEGLYLYASASEDQLAAHDLRIFGDDFGLFHLSTSWPITRAGLRTATYIILYRSSPDDLVFNSGKVESTLHVKHEPSVRVDVHPEERRESAPIFFGHPLGPLGLGEYLLE